jgi:hypothetical protein
MATAKTKTPAKSKTPVFDALIKEARRTPPGEWTSHEQLSQELAITDEERAAARSRIERWLLEDAEEEAVVERQNGVAKNPHAP